MHVKYQKSEKWCLLAFKYKNKFYFLSNHCSVSHLTQQGLIEWILKLKLQQTPFFLNFWFFEHALNYAVTSCCWWLRLLIYFMYNFQTNSHIKAEFCTHIENWSYYTPAKNHLSASKSTKVIQIYLGFWILFTSFFIPVAENFY